MTATSAAGKRGARPTVTSDSDTGGGAKEVDRDKIGFLPSPPTALVRIIRAAGDPEVSAQALARLLELDPASSASVISVANSAAQGLGRPVRSVQQATVVLGLRAIRNLAIGHALRTTTSSLETGDFGAQQFWEDSLRRGTAAMVLARTAGYQDPAEAFTLGLMQDLGCLAMAIRWPDAAGDLQKAMHRLGAERLKEELRLTGTTHPEVFAEVGADWGLPDGMVAVIAGHHSEEPLEDRRDERLRHLAALADIVSDVVQTRGRREALSLATHALSNLGSREPLELEALLEEIAEGMEAASEEMLIEIGTQPTLPDLMSQAGEVLININAGYEELTKQLQDANQRLEETNRLLQDALAEKRELARQLRISNEALKRLAATDVLTGIPNRRAFTQSFQAKLADAAETGHPFSLIMLDIDHFKKVNDTYGHASGDDVLKAVAKRLSDTLREEDVVGRVGGEEFAVLLDGADTSLGKTVAERLRVAIERQPVECRNGRTISVTSSFGGVTTRGRKPPDPDDLLSAADKALYHSKETGRNRVTWVRSAPSRTS